MTFVGWIKLCTLMAAADLAVLVVLACLSRERGELGQGGPGGSPSKSTNP